MQITVWFLFFGTAFQIQRQYLWLYLCMKLTTAYVVAMRIYFIENLIMLRRDGKC